jgi:hypothetical protein
MKRCLLMMLVLCAVAAPVWAAPVVYLKNGGSIRAKSVWRSHGRLYVLVNRDTLTDFSAAEIDLKRTFIRKHHIVKKQAQLPKALEAAPGAAFDPRKVDAKPSSLPSNPKLPEKTPESLVPSSGAGGTIKQHKKEMAERAGE